MSVLGEFLGLLHWQSDMICRDRCSAQWVSILWYGQTGTVGEILQERQLSLPQQTFKLKFKGSVSCEGDPGPPLRMHAYMCSVTPHTHGLGTDVDTHSSQYGAHDEERRSASDPNPKTVIDLPNQHDRHRQRHPSRRPSQTVRRVLHLFMSV